MGRVSVSSALLLLLASACGTAPSLLDRAVPLHEATAPKIHDARMDRFEEMARRAKASPDAAIVFVGDSITEGWEGAGREVWAERYAPRGALQLGVGGDRTEHVLARLDAGQLDGLHPRVLVLMIGTNNTGHRREAPERIADGVTAILQQCMRRLPDTRILLLAIFPRGATPDDAMRRNNEAANRLLRELADGDRIRWVDLAPGFLEPDGSLSKSVMPDLLHLSPDGYRRWADAMEPELARLLAER